MGSINKWIPGNNPRKDGYFQITIEDYGYDVAYFYSEEEFGMNPGGEWHGTEGKLHKDDIERIIAYYPIKLLEDVYIKTEGK